MHYYSRKLEETLKKYLSIFPVIGLTGPRQSGKSTLLLHLLPDYTYISFDDYRAVNTFYNDPEKFMNINSQKVIFDEAHKVPELFNYIKIAVDKNRHLYGNFILSGSNHFTLMKNITESLAGRIGLLSLLPFQYSEIPQNLRDQSPYKGSYPELIIQKYHTSNEWYASYIETYLNKDLRDIAHIGDLKDFRRLVGLLAANTAQIVNLSKFSSELGISLSTIKRWISILEASYIIFLLPPYYKNFGKRITKSPKLYFYDTGLASFLTGVWTKELYDHGPTAGNLFENYIVAEILKKLTHQGSPAELFYFRTNHGAEIDLIVDYKNKKDAIEIKKSATFKPKMTENLEIVMGPNDQGYLLYEGEKLPYTKNISILPYGDYLAI